jgi:hypothetical protein
MELKEEQAVKKVPKEPEKYVKVQTAEGWLRSERKRHGKKTAKKKGK